MVLALPTLNQRLIHIQSRNIAIKSSSWTTLDELKSWNSSFFGQYDNWNKKNELPRVYTITCYLLDTRKYPLGGYILSEITHAAAWHGHWGGDETLKWVLVYGFILPIIIICSLALLRLNDPRVLRMTLKVYFSL